jgi:hypothetical protein
VGHNIVSIIIIIIIIIIWCGRNALETVEHVLGVVERAGGDLSAARAKKILNNEAFSPRAFSLFAW